MPAELAATPSVRTVRWERLAIKELREILRDRRTIITLVLMPILVYPLIGMTFQKFLAGQLTNQSRVEYRLGFQTDSEAQLMSHILREANHHDPHKTEPPSETDHHEPAGTDDDPLLRFEVLGSEATAADLETVVEDRLVDVAIHIVRPDEDSFRLEMLADEHSALSRNARRYLEGRLRLLNDTFLQHELQRLIPDASAPFVWNVRSVDSTGSPPFSLATLVPLILILMTVTGAVYPAIDLTAGERERGTLEALISAPIPSRQLLLAKYAAVLIVALLTAVANLLAMTVTAYITGLESLLFGREGLSPVLILKVFGVLVVFAGFFSAVLLTVTCFARSFKEAQAYLIPVMLVSIAPGILALMPGLEMTFGWAMVPLANIVLLTRDLFEARLAPGPAAVALMSTLIYAAAALVVASKVFGTDAVLYGSTGTWSDLWRRPEQANPQPTLAQVWGCLAVILPTFLLLGSLIRGWVETSLNTWLIAQVAVTTFVFVIIPAASARWQRIPLRSAFRARPVPFVTFIAAAIAGVSLWPFAYEALAFLLPREQIQRMMQQFSDVQARIVAIPYAASLVVFAVAPAVTEELFFRGYFLPGLERGLGRWPAILISAAVFGAFHVFVQGLGFERFIPSTFLGVCLGWICTRTGSVWPGMLLHVLHNGSLLTISQFKDQLQGWGIGVEEQTHLPLWLIGAAGALVLIAWNLMLFSTQRSPRTRSELQPSV